MNTAVKNERLLSIDTLRGFDMFFISGGGTFLVLLNGKTGISWIDGISQQLHHVPWNGFVFYDFIMPLFLFIAGVSLSFSLTKGVSIGMSKTELYKKVFTRMLILIGLGIIYKNAPVKFFEPSDIRYVSVLGRIGLACFVTAVLFLNYDIKTRLYWFAGILVSYYGLLFLVPVPGYGAGDLSFEGNLVGWFDRTFLPGRLHNGTYDELGLLTQFPSLCLTILGSIVGDVLRMDKDGNKKTLILLSGGAIAIAIGLLWGIHFPINKKLWSSSFIMLTGGLGTLSMALFYWIIDVKGFQKWTFFFKVIGMNSLTIYFITSFLSFRYTSSKLFGGLYAPLPEQWHEVFEAFGAIIVVWAILYYMYRKKIFIKI